MTEEPLHRLASQHSLAGRSFAELGLVFKQAVIVSKLPLSEVVERVSSTPVAEAMSAIPPDVLPLPLPSTTAEEARLLTLLDIGTPFSTISFEFKKTIHAAGVSAWLFLLVVALNFLHLGYGDVLEWSAPSAGCLSEGQNGAWEYLLEQATAFVEQPGVVPVTGWSEFLKARRVGYNGDLLMKGLPLTWNQVEPGLPPEELAGSVDAAGIAAPNLRRYLEDPSLSVKPRNAWPRQLLQTRVRAEAHEWQRILVGLYRRRIITFLTDDELVYWRGEALLNGAFGVPKLEEGQATFDPLRVVLRLIINLRPSNALQNMIVGDMDGLPLFSQWCLCELQEHEMYLYSAEDQRGAFYLYKLAAAWLPWFVLAKAAWAPTLKLLDVSAERRWPAMGVIPTGWLSATGIMQHLAVRLCLFSRHRLPPSERPPELSRATVGALAKHLCLKDWAHSYLDDNGLGEVFDVEDAALFAGVPSAYQSALRLVFEDFGVARSTKKAVVLAYELLARGARLDGRRGRATPSPDKLLRFAAVCWHTFGRGYMYWGNVAAVRARQRSCQRLRCRKGGAQEGS